MQDTIYHYEYITVYSDDIIVFRKETTGILRGLKILFPLKGVLETDFYLGGYVGTADINDELMHAFLARTYIKNMSDKIENFLRPHSKTIDHHLRGGILN